MKKKTGRSFFDLSDKEKKEIVEQAAKDSNKAQRELMEKSSDTWKDRFKDFIQAQCEDGGDEKFISEGYGFYDELKNFIRTELKAHDEELVESIQRKKIITPAGNCPFYPCKEDSRIASVSHPIDAIEHFLFYNKAIHNILSLFGDSKPRLNRGKTDKEIDKR